MSSYQNPLASYFLTEDPPPPSDSPTTPIYRRHSQPQDEEVEWIHPPWKHSLHLLLEHPTSSPGATLIHILTTSLILLSALVTILETVPALRGVSGGGQIWFGIETSLVAIFTVEYIARCVAWSSTWLGLLKWMFSFFALTDLLSVLPYYIEILLHQDTSTFFRFSILRMFRLLRVFRPFRYVFLSFSCLSLLTYAYRYNHTILLTIEVMYLSVRRSQHALAAIGFFVVCVMSVWSTVL
jgi:potassium voltage-gated channel Shal-related subfamily D member 2